MKKKTSMGMNLQFFADPGSEPQDNPTPQPQDESKDNPTPQPQDEPKDGAKDDLTVEEQLQQLRIENAKLKASQEKACTDASNWKKKYNATLSESEKLAQEKAEREAEKDAELARLRRESAVSGFEKNFLTLGYSAEQAHKAAEAQYDGDTNTLFTIQQQAQSAIIKSKEAEWLQTRPEVNAGAGDATVDDPFLQGFNSVGSHTYK